MRPGSRRNFAGLTAALSVKHELGTDVNVTVISKSDRFQFNPSLIWVPSATARALISRSQSAPTFEARGVEFGHAAPTRIDVDGRRVEPTRGSHDYDYLVIATGYVNDSGVVPGIGPGGNAHAITDRDTRSATRPSSSSATTCAPPASGARGDPATELAGQPRGIDAVERTAD
jgi:NADPH-dependent 2,4-dienoyl-CoA reductase/sulfur reductase-like enzyme